MSRRIAVVALLGCSVAYPALAQTSAGREDIVVVGSGLAPRPGDRAFDVVAIDADRVRENASNRLESVLADVAGLQQFSRSDSRTANPTSQGISLRGIGGNAASRTLLVLDGVPQADPFGDWVPFPPYATDRIGLIRVTRGGGSGYFGPGALAGTVEVESAPAQAQAPFAADLAYGSRRSIEASASATLTRGEGAATLSAAYARGDGFFPTVSGSRGLADRPAPYEQFSAAARTVIAVGAQTELQANLSGFTDTRERGTAFTRNRSEGADASVRLAGRGTWGWSALAYLQTRAFASQFASVDAARTAANPTLNQYNAPASGVGGRFELVVPVGQARDVRFGADVRRGDGRTQENYSYVASLPTRLRVAGGAALTYGLFADGSAELGDLTLTLGGRSISGD